MTADLREELEALAISQDATNAKIIQDVIHELEHFELLTLVANKYPLDQSQWKEVGYLLIDKRTAALTVSALTK